ncbi:MAG: GNAT family N-acetyltransferase [Spirochaetes bacterium]|nr:GNAT family N-acetyltransferase [Spirochaetota bacterium]
MKYYKKLLGSKCYLSPPSPDDAAISAQWFNDIEITMNLGRVARGSSETTEREFLTNAALGKDPGLFLFSIVSNERDALIGYSALSRIDYVHGQADFGIHIGDKQYHGKGFGTEATQLTLDYAFNILNLRNVRLSVFEFNMAGIRAYEKAGFKHIGRRRKAWLIAGTAYDIIFMDAVAWEFKSPYVQRVIEGA